jgi:hypothetical protein
MDVPDAPRETTSSAGRRLLLWGILLALSVLAIGAETALRVSRQAARDAQMAEYRRQSALTTAALQMVYRLFRANRTPGFRLTADDLSQQLNGGIPLQAVDDSGAIRRWKDPTSGLVVQFHFDSRGQWLDYGIDPGRASLPNPPPDTPAQSVLAGVVKALSWVLALWLWMPLWLVALIAMGIARPPQRAVRIEMFLAAAIGCAVGRYLDPAWPFQKDVMNPPELVIGVIAVMTGGSIGVIMLCSKVAEWRARPKEPRCHECGYNLTGNLSGVCPECGKAVEILVPLREKAHG